MQSTIKDLQIGKLMDFETPFLQNDENLLVATLLFKLLYLLRLKTKSLEVYKAEPLRPREKKLILETSSTARYASGEVLKPRSPDPRDKTALRL